MFSSYKKAFSQAVSGELKEAVSGTEVVPSTLGDQLIAATAKHRAGTVSLLHDRVVLLAVIATITTCANVMQPSFVENKAPTRKAIWDILIALGGMSATLILQYAGDEKYSTPKGLPGRNAPE